MANDMTASGTMRTHLTFLNQQAGGDADVVLFQKLGLPGAACKPLAWKVIQRCGRDCTHPFSYADQLELNVIDAYGNHTPRIAAGAGGRYRYAPVGAGRQLCAARYHQGSDLLLVRNELTQGAIRALLSKDGRPLALSDAVAPRQIAGFQLGPPLLWIALASGVHAGQVLPAQLIGQATALPLAGLASATVVLRGGGSGAQARAHSFTLERQVLREA
jgi:hypothetical protein